MSFFGYGFFIFIFQATKNQKLYPKKISTFLFIKFSLQFQKLFLRNNKINTDFFQV